MTINQSPLTLPLLDDEMPNTAYAFGIDLSKHNTSADGKQKVDFDIIAAHSPMVNFIGMRAGISWGYQDPWFNYYFTEGLRIKRILMPYHVIYPGESAIRQMDNFFRILGNADFTKTPLVLDLELDHGQTVTQITRTTAQAITHIRNRTGRKPIIYSRTQWVNQFLHVPDLPDCFWWLAQYRYSLPYPLYTPEYPCPPNPLPKFVRSWSFHQTSQRGRSIGAPGLYYMDYNRFNGNMKDLLAFAGWLQQPQPTPATCPIDQQPCDGSRTEPQEPEEQVHRVFLSAGCDGTRTEEPTDESYRRYFNSSEFWVQHSAQSAAGNCDPREQPPVVTQMPAWLVHKSKFSPIKTRKNTHA